MDPMFRTCFRQAAHPVRTCFTLVLLAVILTTGIGCPPLRPTAARWGHQGWPTTLPTTLPIATLPTGGRKFHIAAVELFAAAPPKPFVDELRDQKNDIASVFVLDGRIPAYASPPIGQYPPRYDSPKSGTPPAQHQGAVTQVALDAALAQARQKNADYLVCFAGSGAAHQRPTPLSFFNIFILPIFVLPNADVRGACEFRAAMVDVPTGQVVALFSHDSHDNALATGAAAKHGEGKLLTAMLVRGASAVGHDVAKYLKTRAEQTAADKLPASSPPSRESTAKISPDRQTRTTARSP